MIKIEDAYDMAAKVWGGKRMISVERCADRFNVNLTVVGNASDTRDRTYSAHTLDADGRVICHDDCKLLDTSVTIIPIRGNKNGIRL